MIKAVVFDWDGTLVDNMGLHFISFREALKDLVDIKPMDLYLREGRKSIDIAHDLARGAGEHEIQEAWKNKGKIYEELSRDIRILPEARGLIMRLKGEGLKIGLATGTRREALNLTMGRKEAGMFDCIVTGDDTRKAKPNPEPYLKCLRGLGVRPGESMAVENAPLGIESAKSAGMTCIAITSTLPESYLKGADFVVKGLREAGRIIFSQIQA